MPDLIERINLRIGWLSIAYLVIALTGSITGQSSIPKRDNGQPKFALLVGLSNYDKNTPSGIEGCINNVDAMREILIKDYGFGSNVVSLIDKDATRVGIIAAFRTQLIENAKKAKAAGKQAVIVYYFCGHGSQYPDADPVGFDEADGKDETFVAWDSRTTGFDIIDDEMDDLTTELRNFTSNTTLILESCHSGTGTRDGNPIVQNGLKSQEVIEDKRKHPFVRRFPPTPDSAAGTYVTISAAHSSRVALSETSAGCKCTKPMGLMTRSLIESLKASTPFTTYRALARDMSSRLLSMKSDQDPQVEGNRDGLLFGNAATRPMPYIEIESIESLSKFGQVVIRAGAAQGLKEGSVISFYTADSAENRGPEGWIANGVVTTAGSVASFVQLDLPAKNPKVRALKITDHAILSSPAFGGGPLSVSLGTAAGAEDAAMKKEIEYLLKDEGLLENQLVELSAVKTRANASAGRTLVLRKARMKELFNYSNAPGSGLPDLKRRQPWKPATYCAGNELRVRTPNELFPDPDAEVYYLDAGGVGSGPLFGKTFDLKDRSAAGEIAASIRSYAFQQNLRSLDNSVSELPPQIEVSFERIPDEALKESCEEGELMRNPNGEKYKDFENLTFEKLAEKGSTGLEIPVNSFVKMNVKNVSGTYLRSKGKVSGMPYFISVVKLSDDGKITLAAGSTGANEAYADGVGKTFYLRTSSVPGVERFVIVITTDPADFSFFETRGTRRTSRSVLETLLTQSGSRTRTASVTPDAPDKWGVKRVELNVTDRK